MITTAAIEFTGAGYSGTSTDAIARRAGVSQPYLFQLFGTKKDLFIAAIRDCFLRTKLGFEESARTGENENVDPATILQTMGHAYVRSLMGNPNLLRLQLQAYAACVDDDIRAVVRANYKILWETVSRLSGADQRAVLGFFAEGMLINVVATIGEGVTFEDFFASLLGGAPDHC